MGNMMIKTARRVLWKIMGSDPRLEYYIDLTTPRTQMIGYAAALVEHSTRVSRKEKKIGEKDSLLGDYLEFGCYKGDSIIAAFHSAAVRMPWMRFFAFDSFEGLPEPCGVDNGGPFWKNQFSCNKDDFINNLKSAGVDLTRVICVSGWFDKTLTPELKKDKSLTIASIVYIDCDLYQSCVPVLEFITDIVETGSVIMFDDWFSFKADPEKGVQRAFAEWLSRNSNITAQPWHLFGAYGKSFIVKKAD